MYLAEKLNHLQEILFKFVRRRTISENEQEKRRILVLKEYLPLLLE